MQNSGDGFPLPNKMLFSRRFNASLEQEFLHKLQNAALRPSPCSLPLLTCLQEILEETLGEILEDILR